LLAKEVSLINPTTTKVDPIVPTRTDDAGINWVAIGIICSVQVTPSGEVAAANPAPVLPTAQNTLPFHETSHHEPDIEGRLVDDQEPPTEYV
jgi:hypothetical protein